MKRVTLSILRKARAAVADGWIQGDYECTKDDGSACFCAVGAVNHAEAKSTSRVSWSARRAALKALTVALAETRPRTAAGAQAKRRIATHGGADADKSGYVIAFNDTKGRKREDVVALFDAAIERVENGKVAV